MTVGAIFILQERDKYEIFRKNTIRVKRNKRQNDDTEEKSRKQILNEDIAKRRKERTHRLITREAFLRKPYRKCRRTYR